LRDGRGQLEEHSFGRRRLTLVSDDGLRAIFDQDADLYARARPRYPFDLFVDLGGLADVGPGARVVEIGPGTGQATGVLAARGAHVIAVELGSGLAAVLRRELADASVDVVVSAFEDWPLPREPFDTLVAFTAWRRLDPAVRTAKAATALRPGGALATVTTSHVLGGTTAFFADVQDCYERWDPSTPPGLRLPPADEVPPDFDEVDDSEVFRPAVRRRYQQDVAYTTSSYLDLLSTYSGHRALRAERRRGLLTCIAELIDRMYGGTIIKRYLYELRVARKQPSQ
jgi:SAM-dependent methyltransferase